MNLRSCLERRFECPERSRSIQGACSLNRPRLIGRLACTTNQKNESGKYCQLSKHQLPPLPKRMQKHSQMPRALLSKQLSVEQIRVEQLAGRIYTSTSVTAKSLPTNVREGCLRQTP